MIPARFDLRFPSVSPIRRLLHQVRPRRAEERITRVTARFNLSLVKAVIFDLDGTLYSNAKGPFARAYIPLAEARIPAALRPAFRAEVKRAEAGQSPFRSGRVYDERDRKVLRLDENRRVVQAFHLGGSPLSPQEVRLAYPHPIPPKSSGFLEMEGGVWVLSGIAHSFGLTPEMDREIYRQIYQEVLKDPEKHFQSLVAELPEFFEELSQKGCKIVVITNTQREMSEAILKAMGVFQHVNLFVPEAGKPEKSQALLRGVLTRFSLKPRQVLSVGDSSQNDLQVPHRLGMQTLILEDFPSDFSKFADARAPSIRALIRAFQEVRD